MRILLLTPRLPYPPDRGDTLRSWGLLDGLAHRHEVWLATIHHKPPTPAELAQIKQRCRVAAIFVRSAARRWLGGLCSLLAGRSLTEGYFCDGRAAATLRRWSAAAGFDAVVTFSSSVAPLANVVSAPRRILDICDVDSAKWMRYAAHSGSPLRWLYALEGRRVRILEAQAAAAHDVCLLVNRREQGKLAALLPEVLTDVVPTAVDVAAYREVASSGQRSPPEPTVGVVGSMFYPPNVQAVNWFGREVWPQVRRQVPAAKWLIVGARPGRQVRRWGRCPNVTVTGYVPDVRPYLKVLRVFISPVTGDIGVQSKVVVALAAGRPAVVTPDVAAGLEYDDPPPFLVADDPDRFAAAVVRLLTDDGLWRGLHRRAQEVAESYYRVERQVALVEKWLAAGRLPAEEQVVRSSVPAADRTGAAVCA